MLTRQQHLQFCKVCKNRKFSPEQGIVCQLTEKRADFNDSCEHYNRDNHLIQMNQVRREESRQRKLKSDFTFGLNKVGIKNGIVAGILLTVGGLAWLIIGLNYGFIFWYPLILVLMGITALIIGLFNALRRAAEKRHSISQKDDNILDQ